ncbi:hypothetical protein B1A98_19365 [Bacillus badius]|nr:hypothetical protein B1A98_19365 [Bacillus badius]
MKYLLLILMLNYCEFELSPYYLNYLTLYVLLYIWFRNGNRFWFFPTFVGRNMIIGYGWRWFG